MIREIRIVPLQEKHASVLAELEKICFSEPRSEALLRGEVHNSMARWFVAEYTDEAGRTQIAGYAGMQSIVGECYVDNIAVFPEMRGQGIGRKLTETLLKTAREERSAFVTLEVRPSNKAAVQLYHSLGFAEVGTRKRFYTHPTEDALLMTCYFWEKP